MMYATVRRHTPRGVTRQRRLPLALLLLAGCTCTLAAALPAAEPADPAAATAVPAEPAEPAVAAALTAIESAPPAKEAEAAVWGAWLHQRSAAKKQLLAAGDLAVAPLVARVRDILGLDRNGQEVLQGRNAVLHSYYSILASLQPPTAGPLFLEIAALRKDHPYAEERAWALWALSNLTFQDFLADLPQPTDEQLTAGQTAAQDWWTRNGAKPWAQWREDAIARAHEHMDGVNPDQALTGLSFLLSQNLIDATALKALKSLIGGEGRTWDGLRNYHQARAISLAVRLRRVEFESLFQVAALNRDPAIAQAGVAALGATGTAASLDALVKLAADPDPDRAADALIAGSALTGAWQATAEEFKLWADQHRNESQETWWLAGLPGLIKRAMDGDTAALSILYTRVRRPMPPVSLDDLHYPQYGPQIETWQQWYDRVKDTLAWDALGGQVVLARLPE